MYEFLTPKARKAILDAWISYRLFLKMQEWHTVVDFISAIWDTRGMLSSDKRFGSLHDELVKHIEDNYDYEVEEVLVDRLGLLRDDSGEMFRKFIIAAIDSDFYQAHSMSGSTFMEEDYYWVINFLLDELPKHGWEIVTFSYDSNGVPKWKLQAKKMDNSIHIQPNDIPFRVVGSKNGYNSSYACNHDSPDRGPVLLIVFDGGWTDYGVATKSTLFYYDEYLHRTNIGDVKILFTDDDTSALSPTDRYCVYNYMEREFTALGPNFCSLGQSREYYLNLKRLFGEGDRYLSVLLALRDAAYFTRIYERFGSAPQWHSLIRTGEAEKLIHEARPLLHGRDVDNMYNFTFRFRPPYSAQEADELKVGFEFDNPALKSGRFSKDEMRAVCLDNMEAKMLSRRIYGIIGKNGVGKTHFLTAIPLKLATEDLNAFAGEFPLFRKVMAVSNSYYDYFDIPENSVDFNYVYCGHLKRMEAQADNKLRGKKQLKSREEFKSEVVDAVTLIQTSMRAADLKAALAGLVPDRLLEECFKEDEDVIGQTCTTVNLDSLALWLNRLSSGEASLLHIFSVIIANISAGSLILFDEPETHLHPNAISELFNNLRRLCEDFNSFAIIATHSPLVVREIRSECVYVFRRSGDFCSVSKIDRESFGSSIDALTEDIFGNREISKSYMRIIEFLALERKHSEREIMAAVSNAGLPLGLGVRLLIRDLCANRSDD